MSIESILIVLWYSAKPYLGLMTLLMFILLGSYLMKLKKPSFNNKKRLIASCLVGILVGLLAPAITLSKLAYVTTYTDWAALISVMLGVTLYCWLTLTLLFKGRITHDTW